jgi:asparagine synthase (glutamine-hydrolysing)
VRDAGAVRALAPRAREKFFDNDYFVGLLKPQMAGPGGYSFHLWTVVNAVLWHESVEGREDRL